MNKIIVKIISICLSIFVIVYVQKMYIDYQVSKPYTQLPDTVSCLSYEPKMTIDGKINEKNPLTAEQARAELSQLKKITNCVRIYNFSYGMLHAYSVAEELGFNVIAGVWLGPDSEKNKKEVDFTIRELPRYKNIMFLVVGNETQLTKRITEAELIQAINQIKKKTRVKIATAEFSYFWQTNPLVGKYVDIIGLHTFPYWNGTSLTESINSIIGEYEIVKNIYTKKPVYLLETGWPSQGTFRDQSVVGLEEQRKFYREIDSRKNELGNFYNIIEAYDQPWKITEDEGRTGAHWGMYDASGNDKVQGRNSLLQYAGLISIMLTVLVSVVFSIRYARLNSTAHILGHLFFSIVISISVFVVNTLFAEYLIKNPVVIFALIPTQIILVGILITHFLEIIRSLGHDPEFATIYKGTNDALLNDQHRKVSIHIPCRNENPDHVIACVQSCLSQTYTNIEVLLIDNNSTDRKYWEPLKKFSDKLIASGEHRLHFYHVEKLAGFKAGALNFALTKTSTDAVAIAVVDADYIVSPEWIRTGMSYLKDTIKVVQAPQAYREVTHTLFEKAVILEQSMFFEVGMRVRNASNAIIQHGTMCIIDKKALQEVGEWSTWCITEDTELGIRLFKKGYESVYVGTQLGFGIAPATFVDYTKQRFRWVYGAVRMTMAHWKSFFWFGSGLSFKQKYYFLTGWAFWFAHIFLPVFVVTSIIGTYLILVEERRFPPTELLLFLIAYVVMELIIAFLVTRKITKTSFKNIVAMMCVGIGLTPTITKAVWVGLFNKKKPFEVTGRMRVDSPILNDIYNIRWGIFVLLMFAIQLFFVYQKYGVRNIDVILFETGLFLLSLPFAGQVVTALLSWKANRAR
ncbi:MAG: putative glucan biosynthesis protein NdvB [Candidatus Parcubacteria bacterium]|jgi:cellulose synthase/poly-beta-1,6-N-acetylglucosamine synthase-like glycosyltransferase/exo-beta-1,3-glucanase (GH17 family)